jgi:hypothetical protein
VPSLIVLDLVLVLDFFGRSFAGSRALQATPLQAPSRIPRFQTVFSFNVERSRTRTISRGLTKTAYPNPKPQNSKFKTLTPRRESPCGDLVLFFGEELVPDLLVLGLVAVVLQLRHLAADID